MKRKAMTVTTPETISQSTKSVTYSTNSTADTKQIQQTGRVTKEKPNIEQIIQDHCVYIFYVSIEIVNEENACTATTESHDPAAD